MMYIHRGVVIALGLAGCSFQPGGLAGIDPGADGGLIPDAAPIGDACVGDVIPFPPSNLPGGCALPTPAASLVIPVGAWTLNTDSGTLTQGTTSLPLTTAIVAQDGAPDIRAVIATLILIDDGAVVDAQGSLALALVSTDQIVIRGRLDAAAKGPVPGPGGDDPDACATGRGAPGDSQVADGNIGGSGGGGGGYGKRGGDGAIVEESGGAVAAGGASSGSAAIAPLRGGCGGGAGGVSGGVGGAGGGAVQLVAASRVVLEPGAVVTVSGGGGEGAGVSHGGGGGGGSGGGLLVEATAIELAGSLTANGGGGGGGKRDGGGGLDGDNGSADNASPAGGGNGGSNGGRGGNGGAGGIDAVPGSQGNSVSGTPGAAGGGGGGGAVGRIHTQGSLSTVGAAVFSPPRQ